MLSNNLKDAINNAKYLFSMHPAPWGFYDNGLDGYVVDAKGEWIFGGECNEGFVSEDDKEIAALVDVVNSLWVYTKGRK
jgi:hypothetical protein